jgi:hypothetical protein
MEPATAEPTRAEAVLLITVMTAVERSGSDTGASVKVNVVISLSIHTGEEEEEEEEEEKPFPPVLLLANDDPSGVPSPGAFLLLIARTVMSVGDITLLPRYTIVSKNSPLAYTPPPASAVVAAASPPPPPAALGRVMGASGSCAGDAGVVPSSV